MERMTTTPSTQTPATTGLQPVADDKNLLATSESAGSCCGGGCCSTD